MSKKTVKIKSSRDTYPVNEAWLVWVRKFPRYYLEQQYSETVYISFHIMSMRLQFRVLRLIFCNILRLGYEFCPEFDVRNLKSGRFYVENEINNIYTEKLQF